MVTKPLVFNKLISGQLRGNNERVTYTFDIPSDQDIFFEYRANKLVFSTYCIFAGDSQPDDSQCSPYGGNGNDRPIVGSGFIPTNGQAGQKATITLIRVRDGASNYQLNAYTITPQAIKLGENVDGIATDNQPYQTYTLETDPQIPFSVEIEDEAADGHFLWAAHQPFAYAPTLISSQQLPMPAYIDGARSANGATGINQLAIYYLGGNSFRVLVQSTKPYYVNSSNIDLPNLSENQSANLSVNYRRPLLVTKLDIQPDETAQVNFKVTGGKGAIVRVYEEGSLFDKGLSLGWTGVDRPIFNLAGNLQRKAVKALYVVVQIPFDYTRDNVNVAVSWQQIN